jgi:hypothetical protein
MDAIGHAYSAGYRARDFARPLADCPTFCNGSIGQPERDAWRSGWEKRDAEIRRERGK